MQPTEQVILLNDIISDKNTRLGYDPEQVKGFAESYLAGVYVPEPLVRPYPGNPGKFQVVYGNTRFHGALAAQHHAPTFDRLTVKVADIDDATFRKYRRMENGKRKNLDAIEQAHEIQDGLKNGDFKEAIADDMGLSVGTVNDRLMLLKLRPDIQDMVRKGHMPLGHAVCMSKLDKNRQMIVFQWLLNNPKGIVISEFEAVVARYYEQQVAESQVDMFAGLDLHGEVTKLELVHQEIVQGAIPQPLQELQATKVALETVEAENARLKEELDALKKQLAAAKGQVTKIKNSRPKPLFSFAGIQVVSNGS